MKRQIAFVMVIVLLALAACAPAVAPAGGDTGAAPASEGPQQGGYIMVANIEDPDSLDPHKTIMATASSIQGWIYDTLFYIGEDGLPAGLLAESWEVSEDGKTLTVTLREGRTFHDGTPVDAQAVEYTFNRMLDPATAAPAKDQTGPLETVTALDDKTVEFVFSEPYPPFLLCGQRLLLRASSHRPRSRNWAMISGASPWAAAPSCSRSGRLARRSRWCAIPTTSMCARIATTRARPMWTASSSRMCPRSARVSPHWRRARSTSWA